MPDGSDDDVTDINADDNTDDTLSPCNVAKLQASCPDCKVVIDYFQYDSLPRDDAGAKKWCII